MQYFVGLSGYQKEAPFASSLFVDIRKRMGESVFEGFHRAIIEAHDGEKEKINPEPESQGKCKNQSPIPVEKCLPLDSEDKNVEGIQKTAPTHSSSSPWELPPQALTETYVKLSLHTALIVQTFH